MKDGKYKKHFGFSPWNSNAPKWFKKNKPRNLNGMSVGRIDHSKNYRLDNIEFQTISENTKELIRRMGPPGKATRVIEICKNTGLMLNEFRTIGEAAKHNGISKASMRYRVLKETTKKARCKIKNSYVIDQP